MQIHFKFHTKIIGKKLTTLATPKEGFNLELRGRKRGGFQQHLKSCLSEEPCLTHYAKARGKIVTTDASKTGHGIILWQKQSDGEIKPISFDSRYSNETYQLEDQNYRRLSGA